MYTAKITKKEKVGANLQVTVEFTDGTAIVKETITPQDKAGFIHWVKARTASLDSSKALEAEDNIGVNIETVETPATPTADELAQAEWFKDYQTMQEVQKLIDLGVLAGTEAPIVALQTKLKTNFKVEYLNIT